MFQIRYYIGEETTPDIGIGYAPANLGASKYDIVHEFKDHRISESSYLINGSIIELPEIIQIEEDKSRHLLMEGYGQLGIRLIDESVKNLKKTAKKLKIPFHKDAVVPYLFE
jgi:hypothetical protein